MRFWLLIAGLYFCVSIETTALSADKVVLWSGKPPGETKELPPEADKSTDRSRKVAGKRVIRLGNVSKPMLEIFRPEKSKDTGASIIICPGGGHNILAYDLEGTEVAEWLTSIGVTGIVLKYRVPARENDKRYRAAVQDAQRAVSLVRANASKWGIDPQRIGIGGFSAGGETAALTALFEKRTYKKTDATDEVSCRPNFAVLIYTAYLVKRGATELQPHVKVTKNTPPMFLVHTFDDPVTPLSSVLLFAELKKAGIKSELHVFAKGGHGYGLRKTNQPVTGWPAACARWLKTEGWLEKGKGAINNR